MNYKLCLMLAVSIVASAQDPAPRKNATVGNANWTSADNVNYTFNAAIAGPGIRFEGEAVKDAPYSAEAVTETVQTLTDGNRIRRESKTMIYRDSQGRTRREETIAAIGPWSTNEPQKTIFINDPVAGTHYILNTSERTAQQIPQPILGDHIAIRAEGAARTLQNRVVRSIETVTASPDFVGVGPGVGQGVQQVPTIFRSTDGAAGALSVILMGNAGTTEEADLGTRTIEGVQATGKRYTTTLSAEQLGADRDIKTTFERWYSPELHVDMLTRRNDPRMGETTYKLTNVNRTEPQSSLFQPPADYTIQEGPKVFRFGNISSEKEE